MMAPILGAVATKDINAIMQALPQALGSGGLRFLAGAFGDKSEYKDGEVWRSLATEGRKRHFAQRYDAMVNWILFAVEVNFSSFFTGLASGKIGSGLAARLMGKGLKA
jgi:hypothetical protein